MSSRLAQSLSALALVFFLLSATSLKSQQSDADENMTAEQVIMVWVLTRWAHANCPPGTLNFMYYSIAKMVEENAPQQALVAAEQDLLPRFLAAHETVQDACLFLAK